ncbi:F-actin-uncapping protein LRRC16A [Geodia barretti]|uniref:F-actin-uncapping protein LRRC16A n=3 Tax=Geodia barretti TaxID=519541 RepID=A0AA35XKG4_GEOBA|nr:F-actin-uncapping protein LRRC16A [Geodia barretti]
MAREGLTPTPSGDLDVFGKELPLTTAEKQILTGEKTIFLKKSLSIEIVVKKGETTEPRVLVISSSKCFILSHRPTAKLETSFNFLKIQKVECTTKTLTFHLSREPRPLKFHLDKKDSVEVLGLITAQLKNVFPVTPLEMLMQTLFTPVSLREDTTRLRDSLLSAMERLDPTSLHGFITSYGFLCDFFGVPVNEGVTWYLRNVYLTHGFRDLKLHDFNHLAPKEIRPIVSALRHSEFFEGIIEKDNRTDVDLLEEIGYVLNGSRALRTMVLSNCSLKPDNVVRLSTALKNNPRTSLMHLDLSHNPLDDKAVESLGAALELLAHGLQELRLANCKITPRAATTLANCMLNNKLMKNSLVHLDLSSNPLGPDPQGSLGFLKEPQTIATLNLSNCGLSFEFVTPVLMRGCNQHLRVLDLSINSGRSKRGGVHGPKTASQLQQFFSSAISIATINFSGCKLTGAMAVGLLEGLCVNPNVQNIVLNLSGNDLGSGRDPSAVAKVISKAGCVERLDVSESGIDNCLVAYVAAVRMNKSITHLSIGRNFNGKGNSRTAALNGISEFLTSDNCHLRSLCLADSHLRDGSAVVLEALAENRSLHSLNISGNGMGNHGARRLAKALLSNCCLREVIWDHNDTSLHGFRDVASSMEHNYTLRVMPIPLYDIGKAAAREPRELETEVQRIQVYLCRNHSDERLKIELAARHRQRLLTATQQSGVVSRELVQLEDLLKWSERGLTGTGTEETEGEELVAEATLIREEANKVVQLTDGLYAPNVEQEQLESVRAQVAELVGELMGALHHEHVQGNSERMVSQSVKACPSLLTDKDRQLLNTLIVSDMGSEFDVAKKTVVHKVVSEIINPISASNLDLAATISEYLVDKTLAKLEKINSKLIKLQKALQKKTSSGATPDQKVSRAFTFRVEGEESQPKVKRRRPISTFSDSIDLPSGPLETEAPQLQHIVKSRPKPARLQKGGGANRRPHKPAHLAQAKDEVDVGDFVKAVKDAEQNSLRAAKEDEKKGTRGTVPKTPLPLPAETKTKVAESNAETDAAAGKEPPSLSISPPPPPASSSEEKTEGEKEVDVNEEKEKEEEEEEVVEETDEEGAKKEDNVESEEMESEVKEEPVGEDDDSEEREETEGEVVEEEPSSPESASEKVTFKTAGRSPPLTPPPSPPHDTLSPPLVSTPGRAIDDSTSTNDTAADESSSSLEIPTAPNKEPSPSPSEEGVAKDRKKSRKETKKEEKEKEEREREKREREEKERQRKEREREEREREKREKGGEGEAEEGG